MMYLQVKRRAATLASPSVALQNVGFQLGFLLSLDAERIKGATPTITGGATA